MIKVYASKETDRELIDLLAEFKCRVFTNYPIKGKTRKVRGTQLFKVVNVNP